MVKWQRLLKKTIQFLLIKQVFVDECCHNYAVINFVLSFLLALFYFARGPNGGLEMLN